jgi:hypothetical protein
MPGLISQLILGLVFNSLSCSIILVVIFLFICIRVHYANHLGTFINHVMRRIKAESTTKCRCV